MCLIAAGFGLEDIVVFALNILVVAVGLGFVIFVHELGHFAVAKWCGVKCEKFYLGFDVPIKLGWGKWGIPLPASLWKRTWGETTYGIGIIPLGGYVKMLGQDDNPTRVQEEFERAKQEFRAKQAAGELPPGPEPTDPRQLYDPRSYLAQSIPERMAIISAGVIMNVIFAFLMAMVAYMLGVEFESAQVGQVVPGSPAWEAELQPGDKILKINDFEHPVFRDLRTKATLGGDDGVSLTIAREGSEPFERRIVPRKTGLLRTIGVANDHLLKLSEKQRTADWRPVWAFSPAAEQADMFRGGDVLEKVDNQPVADARALQRLLVRNADRNLSFTFRRTEPEGSSSTYTVSVPPAPRRDLGIAMKWGPIVAVQPNSPAAAAGIQVGDLIVAVDGESAGDPATFAERMRRRALSPGGKEVRLSLERNDKPLPAPISVRLREPEMFEEVAADGVPFASHVLGVAYHARAEVASVTRGGPAWPADTEALVKSGDVIQKVEIVTPKIEDEPDNSPVPLGKTVPFELKDAADAPEKNWGAALQFVQHAPPGATVRLTILGKQEPVELSPATVADSFDEERGFLFAAVTEIRQAESFADLMRLTTRETTESLTQVYRFIKKLVTQEVSARLLGGPVTIATGATYEAFHSWPRLLLFLAMLGANLAVVNFLPIPLLDGGHMVFLIYEGIRGKPMSEKVFGVLQYVGLCFLLTLMSWVLMLDFGLIARK